MKIVKIMAVAARPNKSRHGRFVLARFILVVGIWLAGCEQPQNSVPDQFSSLARITLDIDEIPIEELKPVFQYGEQPDHNVQAGDKVQEGNRPKYLARPGGLVAVGSSIFVTDSNQGAVFELDLTDSTFRWIFGTSGNATEELDYPSGIFYNAKHFFIHEPNHRVKVFDSSWSWVANIDARSIISNQFSIAQGSILMPNVSTEPLLAMKCTQPMSPSECDAFHPRLFEAGSPLQTHNLHFVTQLDDGSVAAGYLTLPYVVLYSPTLESQRLIVLGGDHERSLDHPWSGSTESRQTGPFPSFFGFALAQDGNTLWLRIKSDIVIIEIDSGEVKSVRRIRLLTGPDTANKTLPPVSVTYNRDGHLFATSVVYPYIYEYVLP